MMSRTWKKKKYQCPSNSLSVHWKMCFWKSKKCLSHYRVLLYAYGLMTVLQRRRVIPSCKGRKEVRVCSTYINGCLYSLKCVHICRVFYKLVIS